MKTIRFTQAQTLRRPGKPDVAYDEGSEHTLRDDRAEHWLRRNVAVEVTGAEKAQRVKDGQSPPVVQERDYDDAAASIVAGKFGVDYAVPQMAAHFKLTPETVRAELDRRVEALKAKQTETKTAATGATATNAGAGAKPAASEGTKGAGDGNTVAGSSSVAGSNSGGAGVGSESQSGSGRGGARGGGSDSRK